MTTNGASDEAIQATYGTRPSSVNDVVVALKAVKVIVSADGLHAAELEALRAMMRQYGVTPDVAAEIEAFDTRGVDLADVLPKVPPNSNYARMMLYGAVLTALADGAYGTEERVMVARAAQLLGVPDHDRAAIEALVALERQVTELRLGLLA